ncbi:MAG: response regulator [Gemmatimonadales bacterium]
MINLLLVDDDEFVRGALTRALNRTGGFAVIPAEDGRRALAQLAAARVDAILTDLQMPVMDGVTLLADLFERGVRLPVAVMTGQPIHAELRQRLHAYGIAAIFSKPVDVLSLADELQRVLDPKGVGRITGITLFGLLQLLEVERKSGLVVVQASGEAEREGRLYFDHGDLVHAHTDHLEGLEAAYEILGWPDPSVEIFYKRRARQRTVREPLQGVLMEAARLLDERGRGGEEDRPVAAAEPPRDAGTEHLLDEVLKIDGAVGAALVRASGGALLGQLSVQRGLDMAHAASLIEEIVRAARQLDDRLEDVMVTLGKQYHLIRFVGPGHDVFLHVVLDRERASLGLARQQLAKLARRRA